MLPYHKCTDEDYAEFYPVKNSSDQLLKDVRNNPNRGFLCVDWTDDDYLEFVGQSADDDYTRFDVMIVPCNYIHMEMGYRGDSIHPECEGDLQKQIEWMGASNWLVYTN